MEMNHNLSDIIRNNPNIIQKVPTNYDNIAGQNIIPQPDSVSPVSIPVAKSTNNSQYVMTIPEHRQSKTSQTPQTQFVQQNTTDIPQKINVEDELIKQRTQEINSILTTEKNDINSLIDNAVNDETQRLDRHDEALSDPDEVERITGNDAGNIYTETKVPRSNRFIGSDSDYNVDDLLPSYDNDEDQSASAPSETKSDASEEEEAETDLSKELKTFEVATVTTDFSIAKDVREKNVKQVDSNRNKGPKIVQDQAFLNSIKKFKKDHYGVVSIPLVNSGFTISMVGTGVVDLTQLYTSVSDNITPMEYQIEQMRTMIRNVVSTNPRIDPNNLRNMIHFQDYSLMAFAHICATLDKVQTITNCVECGKPFRIEADPKSLILNMDKLKDPMERILNETSIEENSLLTKNNEFTSDDGFVVILGHPSYADIIRLYSEMKEYTKNMTTIESQSFNSMFSIFTLIREIKMPNGIKTSNTFQIYHALKLLKTEDMNVLGDIVKEMTSQIIVPKFGIQKVTCPHCGKVNTNIGYDSLQDMVFYHTQISGLLTMTNPEA